MNFFRWKQRQDEDLNTEIQTHLDEAIRERMERGESAEEARRNAQREFGNVGLVKEVTREMWGWGTIERLLQDLRFGLRMLRKNPSFTFIAVLTLALGIGANTAIFSIVNGVLLKPLPYRDPQQLVMVWATRRDVQEFPVMAGDFVELRSQNQSFAQVAAFQPQSFNLTASGEPEVIGGLRASANLFTLLGIDAALGRTFLAEEDQPGTNRVVILSHNLWQRRFGANAQIIGQTISLNNEPYTVVGVAPPNFQFPRKGDMPSGWPFPGEINIYMPIAFTPEQANDRRRTSLAVIARLKPEVGTARAQAELGGLAEQWRQRYPDAHRDKGLRVISLHQQVASRIQLALWVLQGAVGFVLLIACANVANLLLARSATRQKEMAVRAALGAGRGRVIRQMLTESLLLALLGGACAWLMSFWSVNLLRRMLPENVPRADEIGLDGQVFGFLFVLSLLAGVLFGLAPAWQASRTNLSDALKEGGRNHSGVGSRYVRNALVVTEVALALVLLIGAGLLVRSFARLMNVDPGVNTRNVLTADVRLPRSKYPLPQQKIFFQQLLIRLRALPGVQAAGAIYPLPFSGTDEGIGFYIEGHPPAHAGQLPTAAPRCVGADYFQALQIPVKRGRVFTDSDGPDASPVLVINEAMAREVWPNENPLGKRLSIDSRDGKPVWREIVGVVGDIKHLGLEQDTPAELYFPFTQFGFPPATLVVRGQAEQSSLLAAIRHEVQALDQTQPLSNVRTLDELLDKSVAQRRFNLLLLGIFAGVALLLATLGIYGVMSYLVAQRKHEMGIRLALGARPRDVLLLVVRQGMTLAFIGVAVGLAAALGLTRLMVSLLFDVRATDPLTFVGISLLLLGVAFIAAYLPARNATKVDPLIALRHE